MAFKNSFKVSSWPFQRKSSKEPMSRGGILVQPEFSGKMQVLARMLAKIRKETNDKIELISNYSRLWRFLKNSAGRTGKLRFVLMTIVDYSETSMDSCLTCCHQFWQ
ncbi:hypothetical protein BGX34_011780 [Mortierella sp. NVP85]|nr:hypothetical protein BGX34_011780 [Mortierella sp. NVP85]